MTILRKLLFLMCTAKRLNLFSAATAQAKGPETVTVDGGVITISGTNANASWVSETVLLHAGVQYTLTAHIKPISKGPFGDMPFIGLWSGDASLVSEHVREEGDVSMTYTPAVDTIAYVYGSVTGENGSPLACVAEYSNITLIAS